MSTYDQPATVALGLLTLRLVLGLYMAAHGAQKLFGWFGGYGLGPTGQFFTQLGYRQGKFFAFLAAFTEVVSGLLVAVGLLGPVGPALMVSVMIVAAVTVHWKGGLFSANNGIEVNMLFAAGAVLLALVGYGRYALDAVLGVDLYFTPAIVLGALAVGALGGIANLLIRRPPAAAN
ncbi:MAG TPA: DoxX family protein [Gemmatimonas sp.]|uniref:DoxX family protein n=1 Tax=Gemmatimonas sp. TaxID=1962908 RepID=UPI002ED7DC0B